jgi:hypothetical protein
MENDQWPMANDEWQMANERRLSPPSFDIGHLTFDIRIVAP